jgi:hypothetical protein
MGKPEQKAVDYVLAQFFDLREDGFHQQRTDLEIERFRSRSAKAKASSLLGVEARRSKLPNGEPNGEPNGHANGHPFDIPNGEPNGLPLQSPVSNPSESDTHAPTSQSRAGLRGDAASPRKNKNRQSKRHGASERADPQPPTDARDHLEFFANRLLLQHVASRGGLGSSGRFAMGRGLVDCKASPELQACLRAKRSIVDEFASYVREGDELATPAEFMRAWSIVLRKVSKVDDALLAHWGETAQRPALQQPFPAHMARELP